MEQFLSIKYIVAACVYSILGIVILAVSFIAIDRLTPYHLWKGIIEDKNIALAIVTASMILGVANIIAASVNS